MSNANSKDWWAPIRNGLVTDPRAKHIKAMRAALKKISQEPHHPLVRVLALYFSARGTMP